MFIRELHTLNIAHRGARSLAPENTMFAAQKAFMIGADLWELDVAETLDSELVVIHDDTLNRTSNVQDVYPERSPWLVHQFTLAELRQLDFGSWFNRQDPFGQIAAGAVSPAEQRSYIGAKIPTLKEALLFTREHSWYVNVEIKDLTGQPGDERVVEDVVALVHELEMVDRVMISSFNHAYLKRCQTADSSIMTAALVETPGGNPEQIVRACGAWAYNPGSDMITPEEAAVLESRDLPVNIWTVNDPKQMQALIDAGINGIFTDFPQLLRQLEEN